MVRKTKSLFTEYRRKRRCILEPVQGILVASQGLKRF
uniref:Uncharacterized protein n=1 Tax=Anguilla anguilla TaxID=7936 RepID=A0A0E9V6R8_ANGAN